MKPEFENHLRNVGKVLFQLREEKGLSQEALANLANVDRGKISRMENGRADFSQWTVFLLAKALGVDVKRFYEFESLTSNPSE